MSKDAHVSPLPSQVLCAVSSLDGDSENTEPWLNDREMTMDIEKANLLTSMVIGSDKHKPVIDIDFPAQLIPSTTPGHFHLLIDHEVEWKKYAKVLKALAAAGIIQPGYASASIERKHTAVRLPWIKKRG